MDLSQQELPLTSYFARTHKDSKPRVVSRKKNKHTEEDSSSVARPSKRNKNEVPPSKHGLRPTTLQLPTPATSARKCTREETQLDATDVVSPVEPSASEKRPAQLVFGSRSCCPDTRLSDTSLATPLANQRKTINPVERESSPTPQRVIDPRTGMATPRTSSRRLSEPTCRIDSSPLNDQPSRGLPMFPVSSSQSQYLLPVDATPKRKRRPQRIEHVISSQTQEERELTLSSSVGSTTMLNLPVEHTPRKNVPSGDGQNPCLGPSRQSKRRAQALDRSPVRSHQNTPPHSSCFLAKKKVAELPPEPLTPLPRKESTLCHSSSRKIRTPKRLTFQDPIASPVHIDDSLTEPESDRDFAQAPPHPSVSRDDCPPIRREFVRDNLPVTEDDSATETESDTEILRCVAEIGNKRPRERRPEISETPPAPVISPLVSPARPRIAPMPMQFSVQQGAKSAVHQSAMEQPCTRSDSLPSVVRDFIRMFPGDESYPADFPESLRV